MISSIIFYSVVTYMINGVKDVYFASLDSYGKAVEPFIDNLMYFQLIVGTSLIMLYTYRMEDHIEHETLDKSIIVGDSAEIVF